MASPIDNNNSYIKKYWRIEAEIGVMNQKNSEWYLIDETSSSLCSANPTNEIKMISLKHILLCEWITTIYYKHVNERDSASDFSLKHHSTHY